MTKTLAETGLSSPTRKYIKYLQVFMFAPYKAGKTVASHFMPRTRTLDFDNGMQSVEWAIRKGIIPKSLNEIAYETMASSAIKDKDFLDRALNQVWKWVEEEDIPDEKWDRPYPKLWDTLVVDSMTPVNDSSITLALSENNRLGLSKSWKDWQISEQHPLRVRPTRVQDYGAAASLEKDFIQELRKLPKNLVVTAHERVEMDEDGNVRKVEPALVGQARMTVPALFDEVWYMRVEGARSNPKFVMQTSPDNLHRCGSRLGCLDIMQEANFEEIKKRIAEFYEVDPNLLWTAAHGMKDVEAEMKRMEQEADETNI